MTAGQPNDRGEWREILDISQPIDERSAVFPGDVPFSRNITVSYASSGVINLTAFTMSPHVGTHADAPVHVQGDLANPSDKTAGAMNLSPYVGPCEVVNFAPKRDGITPCEVTDFLETLQTVPPRLLFRTRVLLRYEEFANDYAWFEPEAIDELAQAGVQLVGIDTPSVDHVDSKTLLAHHRLIQYSMRWLENLDLSRVEAGAYHLMAAPLKFTQLEASPVRAVLLR